MSIRVQIYPFEDRTITLADFLERDSRSSGEGQLESMRKQIDSLVGIVEVILTHSSPVLVEHVGDALGKKLEVEI
jgi:hypothetical protein